jgi:streptomycin 6-kinase
MPGLSYHFVAKVEVTETREIAILKMAPTNENIGTEARWLQHFKQGVPIIYWFDETLHAYLMEQLVPGVPLKTMVRKDDDQATRIICQTIRAIHSREQTENGFKHLSELAKCLPSLTGLIDNKILSKAISLFAELTQDRTHDVLLHGDLHHDNILSCGNTWKAIDPHGYVGDPAFEIGPMIYNPGGQDFPDNHSLQQTITRRLQILSEELPYDAKRMHAWAFCMTILSIAWTCEDHYDVPAFEWRVAEVLDVLTS